MYLHAEVTIKLISRIKNVSTKWTWEIFSMGIVCFLLFRIQMPSEWKFYNLLKSRKYLRFNLKINEVRKYFFKFFRSKTCKKFETIFWKEEMIGKWIFFWEKRLILRSNILLFINKKPLIQKVEASFRLKSSWFENAYRYLRQPNFKLWDRTTVNFSQKFTFVWKSTFLFLNSNICLKSQEPEERIQGGLNIEQMIHESRYTWAQITW